MMFELLNVKEYFSRVSWRRWRILTVAEVGWVSFWVSLVWVSMLVLASIWAFHPLEEDSGECFLALFPSHFLPIVLEILVVNWSKSSPTIRRPALQKFLRILLLEEKIKIKNV